MDKQPHSDQPLSDQSHVVVPDGSEAALSDDHSGESSQTERGVERAHEDRAFLPVILKRSDLALRHPDDTLEKAIEEGVEQLQRPTVSLLLSSIAAGMFVGFSGMAVAVVTEFMMPFDSLLATRLATAFVYPLGFVVCVMSGAQLFTEHTATAVYPVLDGRATVRNLLRLWLLVVIGNMIGVVCIALLLTAASDVIHADAGFMQVAEHLVSPAHGTLFVSAVLAGWLMAMGAWLVMSTPPDLSQIVSIYIVTFLIGIGGLHHSIAGSAEMITALLLSDQFSLAQASRFIILALAGNLVGGSVFVGVLNYAYIRKTQPAEP